MTCRLIEGKNLDSIDNHSSLIPKEIVDEIGQLLKAKKIVGSSENKIHNNKCYINDNSTYTNATDEKASKEMENSINSADRKDSKQNCNNSCDIKLYYKQFSCVVHSQFDDSMSITDEALCRVCGEEFDINLGSPSAELVHGIQLSNYNIKDIHKHKQFQSYDWGKLDSALHHTSADTMVQRKSIPLHLVNVSNNVNDKAHGNEKQSDDHSFVANTNQHQTQRLGLHACGSKQINTNCNYNQYETCDFVIALLFFVLLVIMIGIFLIVRLDVLHHDWFELKHISNSQHCKLLGRGTCSKFQTLQECDQLS